MPRNQNEDATNDDVVARVVLTKRGAFARCCRCGSSLVEITNISQIVPIGYTFDGRVWSETVDRRTRRERDQKAVGTGRASGTDRQRLRHNEYGRTGNGSRDRWARALSGVRPGRPHSVPEGYADRFQLPQWMKCGPCGAENLIEAKGRIPTHDDFCRRFPEIAKRAGLNC
jgi:hypothetical protein